MSEPTKPDATEDPIDRARRRLLIRAAYIPPTVIGIISLKNAGCAPTASCQPSSCAPTNQPCQPDNNPCGPNTGCNPDNCPPRT